LPLVQGNADIRDRRTIGSFWTTAPAKKCAAGNVLLTVRAPVGFTAVATSASCLGRGVCSIASASGSNRYLYHALVRAEPQWAALEQGSTFTAANSDQVRAFALLVPDDPDEQTAIGEALDAADSEIRALRDQAVKAQAIKHGMMQQLLTGRVRLPRAKVIA